jgi:hypothetical protein
MEFTCGAHFFCPRKFSNKTSNFNHFLFFSIARKAALAVLVDEETELLATIDRYKTEAQKYNKEINIQRFLERVAQPKKWKYKDGTTTEME